jgi:tRNA threonylcarbamoyladenosine biosynthesis protein TsaE
MKPALSSAQNSDVSDGAPASSAAENDAKDQRFELILSGPEATLQLAQALAAVACPGDCILLEGPIGAGKSAFARGFIQSRMATYDRVEDVPSPTFTLVQIYDLPDGEIWHADLYRLTHPDEALELGLDEAMETAICLIEWPDRLGTAAPTGAIRIALASPDREDTPAPEHVPDSRVARITLPQSARAALTDAIRSLLP